MPPTEPNRGTPSSHSPLRRGDAGVAEFVSIIRRRRRMVFLLAFGLPLLTAAITLFVSNKYTAHGTVLVETPEGGIGSDLMAQITAVTGLAPQVPPTEMYLAILSSERTALAVADSLDLATHYDIDADTPVERVEKTLRKMSKRVEFSTPDLVSINVSATDPSRTMAAAIVNAYLESLEHASETLSLSRARRTRTRVEKALGETMRELNTTRKRLQSFQEEHGVFSIDKQTEGTLELIATLQTELLAAQTEREALSGFASGNSGRLKSLDFKINALNAQIQRLVGLMPPLGAPADSSLTGQKPTDSFFIPLGNLPGLAGEYARILMDLKVQEAKYNVLATQLEQTKIDESESIPAFDILDRARVPYKKSSPKRTLYVLAAFLGGLLTSILLAVFLDDLDRRVGDDARDDLEALTPGFLRGAFRRLLPRRGDPAAP